ncbi:beta-ketoacyl synthase [Actinoplanes sp. SE50]|uniref:type I polyketide synthase n=1 Tax=unclassified Actinoplanes TaxID=2626549 RepID=UPI00023EC503|nr:MULTISPECIES: type I polyketide synthase [unclassified Actinoplanes]AEV87032.1 polyketide synthase [Actinoplanes sp. SE50/110]ATO85430.1 beta-ketoacyl synthase [Actinoplanes sp. SE50]SLM02842.1 polyketide synthase [Actinoplanes sp. SE50/110]
MDQQEIRQLMATQLEKSRRLQARIGELEAASRAPVAVVGMGLRLPGGVTTPEDYWDLLHRPGDASREIPADRPGLRAVYDPVPGRAGRSYVDRAGFLDDVADFDAEFFGISQREAARLDPQQRMLLETAWEALERAGVAVRRADRLDVGVYLGMMASEYNERFADRGDAGRVDPYYTTGGGLCFGAGRISYVMGFKGPVISVDTACSSSLSALHLAVRALRSGECRYALVCGSNLLLSANLMVSLSQARALSPGGRSRSFLAGADGYGRGEGVGVLVLQRLADAERERRPVLAVVRGTAMNSDGAASGLTAPNGPAQQEVVRAALRDAGIDPAELGWVEAHGTGTALGDPIEVHALAEVLGESIRRRGVPLAIGSVKARLGHLEAASGIAAVMKTALMLRHGEIPAALDPEDGPLNEHIDWAGLPFTVPRDHQPWPAVPGGRVASVNSFGMSGTNVHAVLAAAPPVPDGDPVPPEQPHLLTLSARSMPALTALARAVASRLGKAAPAEIASICHTLRCGRTAFPYRLAVVASTGPDLAVRIEEALRRPIAAAPRGGPGPLRLRSGDAGAPPLLHRLGVRTVPEPGTGPARLAWGDRRYPLTTPELTLTAVAALFEDGADLRFDALRGPHDRFVDDLPTYPFQRRRCWVDEPVPDGPAVTAAPERADGAVPDAADRTAVHDYLAARLREVLDADELDEQRSFLDSGGDSFASVLFVQRVEEAYEVGVRPEDLPLDLPLAEFLGRLAAGVTRRTGTAS